MKQEKVHEFSNGEMTIMWRPNRCIHSGKCVGALPQVYKPGEKPWILINNASTEELIAQVKTCPSGALTYRINK